MLKTFDKGRLFGRSFGGAVASVLALHGWQRSHRDFDAVLQGDGAGSGDLDAIAVDLPGFGATPAPTEPWGSPQYAEALAPLLDTMSEGVMLVGHSFGGRVAIHLAAGHPERVRGLVLTGVPLLGPGARRRPVRAFRAATLANRWGLLGDGRMEDLRMRYGSEDYRAARGIMRQVLGRVLAEDYAAALQSIRCPVELVWGDDDRDAPIAGAERALGILSSGRLTVVQRAGHMVPLTAPARLRSALESLA